MKRYILFLVLAVILFEPSYGQITRESYDKAVDILNYQSVYYSLSVLSPTTGVTAQFKSNCNCENNPTYEKIKLSIPGTELKTIEISKEIQELKNQDLSAFNKGSALEFLINDVFDKSLALSAFKNELEQKGKFSDYTEIVAQKLDGALQENIPSSNSNQTASENKISKIEERTQALESRLDQPEEKSHILSGFSDYLILFAIVLGIFSLFLALKKGDNYDDLMPKILESKRLNDLITSQSNTGRVSQNDHSKANEIRDIHNRIRDLELQLSRLNKEIGKTNQSTSISSTSPSITEQEIRQPEPKTETLFLSTPNSDGSFNESSASNTYKDGASIYRFIKTGSANAKFQIDEKETSIKLALQYPDKNIDPGCEAENAFNPRANRISTIKMGEADLQNGKWIINSKAIIRYED